MGIPYECSDAARSELRRRTAWADQRSSLLDAIVCQGVTVAMLRKQYFFRQSAQGLLAWDVDRLIELSAQFPRRRVALSQIRELDEPWSGFDDAPTWRSLVAHVRLMDDADLGFPIILAADGRVMDGMHRVARALRLGLRDIEAVQFSEDPPPDHVGRGPADLPYPDPS